jgi:multidrug efflux system membrane fusion protein
VSGTVSSQQLDTARALVKQLEASVESAQAMIDNAQVNLDYSRIRSPLDGRAGPRLIDSGNMVKATDTGGIVIINQLDPIFVTFPLPSDSVPAIRIASEQGEVKVRAQDSGGRVLAVGKLAAIGNQINPNTAATIRATCCGRSSSSTCGSKSRLAGTWSPCRSPSSSRVRAASSHLSSAQTASCRSG